MTTFSRWSVKKKGPLFEGRHHRLGGPEKVVERRLHGALSEVAAFGEVRVKRATPKGETKILVGSVFGELQIGPKPKVLWGTPALYGPAVEEGRRPGRMPPPEALEGWVRSKLRVPRDQVPRVAFLIARKIGRKGTKPRKMFERSIPAIRKFAQKAFDLATKRIADNLNK